MKYNILVADEQAQMRHLLGAIFTQQGYNVKTAQSGKEALETIYDNDFDILVLNHDLPIINGIQLISWLEDNDIYTPIVMMGSIQEATEQRTNKFPAVKQVLNKPFKVQDLTDSVKSVIQ